MLRYMAKSPNHAATRKALAQNVKYARTMMALSQEELAERSKLHRTQVGAIERGTSGASVDTLGMLADAIGVAPSTLLLPPAQAQPLILQVVEKS
jgi:transcriptional regulator with XRE-family HTH domain